MSNNLQAYTLPQDKFECPACGLVFEGLGVVTGKPQGLKDGQLTVCSSCGALLQLRGQKFVQMTPVDVQKLPPQTQNTLEAARQMVLSRIGNNIKRNGK